MVKGLQLKKKAETVTTFTYVIKTIFTNFEIADLKKYFTKPTIPVTYATILRNNRGPFSILKRLSTVLAMVINKT